MSLGLSAGGVNFEVSSERRSGVVMISSGSSDGGKSRKGKIEKIYIRKFWI